MNKKLTTVKLSEIRPYDNNPRHNDGAVDAVKESIKQCEYIAPIIVDEDMVILAGHTRHKALKALGKKEAEVMIVTGLTDEQKRKYRLLDNKTNEFASWDIDALEVELEDLDFEGYDFGFDIEQIEPEPQVEEDDYTETDVETRCKLGDLWQLGNHRLVCGDSTDVNVIERLMDGVKADMVFTDPPYGISVVGSSGNIGGDTKFAKAGGYKKVIGDDEDFEPSFILKTFEQSKIMLWGTNYFSSKLPDSGKWLVWDKNRGEGTTFSDCELCWTNLDGIAVKKYKCTWDGMRREGESGKRVHPTQKPLKLCADIINDYSEKADIIVDLFGGSGSTLIACEQLNRKCYMCELDEHYCDVIIDRWEQFTGKKAVLINE